MGQRWCGPQRKGQADCEVWGLRSKPRSEVQDFAQTTAEKWTLSKATGRGGNADIGLGGSQQLVAVTSGQNMTVQHQPWK